MHKTTLTLTHHELVTLVDLVALAGAATGLTRVERGLQSRLERLRRELERHRRNAG